MVRISVDLPDEVAEALDRAAAGLQSTREALLVEAARGFLAGDGSFDAFRRDQAAFSAWIAEGEADIAAGRVLDADIVFDELDAIAAGRRAGTGG
jgi:predicted transcriptional regulator